MIRSEKEAREVLGHLFRVRIGGKTRELSALAPVRFEKRANFDPSAPIPFDPVADAESHQLICAVWSWKCAAEKMAFELPEDAGQNVILWTQEAAVGAKPRWVLMAGGDVSPAIMIPQRPPRIWGIAVIALGCVGMSIPLVRGSCRKRREEWEN